MLLIFQTLDEFGPQRRGPFNLIVILEAAVECEVRWILIILHSPRTPTTLPYTFLFSNVLLTQSVLCAFRRQVTLSMSMGGVILTEYCKVCRLFCIVHRCTDHVV